MEIFSFLPEFLQHALVSVSGLFVGEGWHLTLGVLFMLIVIFLPGGLMEGFNRLWKLFRSRTGGNDAGSQTTSTAPAE